MVPRARIRKPLRLLEILQEQGLRKTLILISPDHPVPELSDHGAVPVLSPAYAAIVDLGSDQDQMRQQLHQKWRNRLVHAESQGLFVTCEQLPQDPEHWLLQNDHAQRAERGYKTWPVALTLAYARENPGQARVFTAFEGPRPIASVLILRHATAATYHIGYTTRRGKELSAHNLLIWNAMTWLGERGCLQLDLGLINTEDAPGLARFKLGTGARLHRMGGTWAWWPPLGRCLHPLGRLDRGLMTPRKTGQLGGSQFI